MGSINQSDCKQTSADVHLTLLQSVMPAIQVFEVRGPQTLATTAASCQWMIRRRCHGKQHQLVTCDPCIHLNTEIVYPKAANRTSPCTEHSDRPRISTALLLSVNADMNIGSRSRVGHGGPHVNLTHRRLNWCAQTTDLQCLEDGRHVSTTVRTLARSFFKCSYLHSRPMAVVNPPIGIDECLWNNFCTRSTTRIEKAQRL